MRDQIGLNVLPPERKKGTAKNRLEPKANGLKKNRRRLQVNARKLLKADRIARKRNREQEAKRQAAQRAEATPALAAAQELAKCRGDTKGAKTTEMPAKASGVLTGINRHPKLPPVLLYLNHDIAFPSPVLTKVGDGAVHGVSILRLDHAVSKPAPPLFIVSNS